ncbi:MAG: low affinity iron permease family protein [Chthoniobacterales bacterium]|nr:low affinity iron permease family protein [Chthoniobacterales bacterium]
MTTRKKKARPNDEERGFVCRVDDAFHTFAKRASGTLGTPWSFVIALCIILIWGVTGPIFHFSDTWQLIINTGTTIVTFLMVFLLQNTQNRDAKNTAIKLDEIIRAMSGARNDLLDLDRLSEQELTRLNDEFQKLSDEASDARDAKIKAKSSVRKKS